ncbi:TAP42-like protein [Infundibulicybe gibba]|nr:TAP42-like protein [Infundibulicybe gibba]
MSQSILFSSSLLQASKAFNQPTIDDSTQDLLNSSLVDLKTLQSRINELALFSANEHLEDISTRDLVYLLVPYVVAEVQGRLRTNERVERLRSLDKTKAYLQEFLSYLDNYEIIPEDERVLYTRPSLTTDPARRRETKIKQYKKEKELQTRIEVVRKRRGQLSLHLDNSSPSTFELIASLLPTKTQFDISTTNDIDELDSETDDVLREAILLLIRLCFAQTHSHLESMAQEYELLRNAPPSPTRPLHTQEDDRRSKRRDEGADMWRLDTPMGGHGGKGPLLDPSGKPLRPFTILPSDATDRARIQSQVFGPGHRLPTMTVEEYLEIERERGKFITGGGPASQAAPTSSEQLSLDAEMDGTVTGEDRAEVKRLKDENWARFTDDNPKGAGNAMNRG